MTIAHRPDATADLRDALSRRILVLDGAWLAHAGLPMPRTQAETAFLVRLERV